MNLIILPLRKDNYKLRYEKIWIVRPSPPSQRNLYGFPKSRNEITISNAYYMSVHYSFESDILVLTQINVKFN